MPRFRFLLRFLALTGLLVAVAGAVVTDESQRWDFNSLRSTAQGQRGQLAQIAVDAVAGGLSLAAVLFALDLLLGMRTSASRRSALGLNVAVQVLLAAVLLVGVNAWSFLHYTRWDCTRDKAFTINPEVAGELRKLRGETAVIVYQTHKVAGRFSDKADQYDSAAEAKVVEKVRDLVDQLREFGPQFRVVVLDTDDRSYERELAQEKERYPALEAAVRSAPESSIFFCSGPHLQRMSFSEFYQLDKTASKQADGGRGNLVLLSQGIEPFVRRVLAIEEKKPLVGVAVIHEVLTTRSSADTLTLAGLRKSLIDNGFDVRDIILKRWGDEEPKPATYSFEESRLEQLEEDLAEFNASIPVGRVERDRYQGIVKKLKELSLDELGHEFRDQLRGRTMTEEDRQINLTRLEALASAINSDLTQMEDERRKTEDELSKLSQKEALSEGRHVTDLKAKSHRLLDDCDVLIIPRLTLIDLHSGARIPSRLYRIDEAQVSAVRSFLKAGKPIFTLFGPTNEPGNTPPTLDLSEGDAMESLLRELGIVFGDQTVLYNAERTAFAERRVNPLGGARVVEIPPLDFQTADTQQFGAAAARPNPLRESLRVTARSVGSRLDLVLRHPRPVYFASNRARPSYQPEFLFTDAASWNEAKPFPERGYTPRFDPAKPNDPTKGTRDEERRGPFPVGVAVQTEVPPEWIDDRYRALKAAALAATVNPFGGVGPMLGASAVPTDMYTRIDPGYRAVSVRVAAIGQGGVFTSPDATHPDLSPAREQLLLQTVNWLLRRDDRLPHADKVWEYPRVDLSQRSKTWWRRGAILGLPGLFTYLGLVVLMVRRMR